MADPQVRAVKERVQLVGRSRADGSRRAAQRLVEVTLRDGRTVSHFTRHAPGTKENPLDTEGVNAKARGLMAPVLGAERTEAIIRRVNALEELKTCASCAPCSPERRGDVRKFVVVHDLQACRVGETHRNTSIRT